MTSSDKVGGTGMVRNPVAGVAGIYTTALPGLLVLERRTLEDERGFFRELFRHDDLEAALGEPVRFVQQNHARSRQNVLRGFHAEEWEKLVYVARGEVHAALLDIRPESPTFGRTETFIMGESNRIQLWIPRGFANSYYVTSPEGADYIYMVTKYYDGSDTRAIAWDDPDVGYPWPASTPILSQRDRNNPRLRELFPEKFG